MIIRVRETWGSLSYDTIRHRFGCAVAHGCGELPYVSHPVVLNCYLTFKCNMACVHCVAKGMMAYDDSDLEVSDRLVDRINAAPFLAVVITGGEPLLPQYEGRLADLVAGLRNKGIVLDTNGTILPSGRMVRLLKRKHVLVRVSLDSSRPQDEFRLRCKAAGDFKENEKAYHRKLKVLGKLRALGVNVAVQSVLHKANDKTILGISEILRQLSISSWYIQRLIPVTGRAKAGRLVMTNEEYEKALDRVERVARRHAITCASKRDRRHNCVFLLVGDGAIYTQADKEGRKLFLGRLGEIKNYFEFVSASEHSCRYYSQAVEAGAVVKEGAQCKG